MTPYQITEELYVKAMIYSQQKTRSVVIGVCLVVPMAIYVMKGFQRETMMSVLIVYMILGFYFLVLAPMINRMNYQRTYRKNPLLHKTQHFQLTATDVVFKSENGESRYQLDEIKKLMIYSEMVMIYPTTTIFHVIPRGALTDTQLEELRQHVPQ